MGNESSLPPVEVVVVVVKRELAVLTRRGMTVLDRPLPGLLILMLLPTLLLPILLLCPWLLLLVVVVVGVAVVVLRRTLPRPLPLAAAETMARSVVCGCC